MYDGVENSAAILNGGVLLDTALSSSSAALAAGAAPAAAASKRLYFPYYSSHLEAGPGIVYNSTDGTAELTENMWPPLMAVRDKQFKLHVWTYGIKRPSTGRGDWTYRDASWCAAPLQNWDFSNMSCTDFGPKNGSSDDPASPDAGSGCTFINRTLHTIWREPLLFDLLKDPGENVPRTRLAGWDGSWPAPGGWHSGSMPEAEYDAVVKRLQAEFDRERGAMPHVLSQVQRGNNVDRFPCCNPGCTPRPQCCTCDGEEGAQS